MSTGALEVADVPCGELDVVVGRAAGDPKVGIGEQVAVFLEVRANVPEDAGRREIGAHRFTGEWRGGTVTPGQPWRHRSP